MTAIVQINFPYTETTDALLEGANQVAPVFAGMDGLLWKVWLVDEARGESGGIYLFRDRSLADAYAQSDIVAHLRHARPGITVRVSTHWMSPACSPGPLSAAEASRLPCDRT